MFAKFSTKIQTTIYRRKYIKVIFFLTDVYHIYIQSTNSCMIYQNSGVYKRIRKRRQQVADGSSIVFSVAAAGTIDYLGSYYVYAILYFRRKKTFSLDRNRRNT